MLYPKYKFKCGCTITQAQAKRQRTAKWFSKENRLKCPEHPDELMVARVGKPGLLMCVNVKTKLKPNPVIKNPNKAPCLQGPCQLAAEPKNNTVCLNCNYRVEYAQSVASSGIMPDMVKTNHVRQSALLECSMRQNLKRNMSQFKEIPVPPEEWEQKKVIQWKRENQSKYPELQLLFASLNGIRLTPGLRVKAKAQGLEPGYPDLIMLDVPRGQYHGLRIELKRLKGNTTSPDQKRVIEILREQGYCVEVCKGHVEAINTIIGYLNSTFKVARPMRAREEINGLC